MQPPVLSANTGFLFADRPFLQRIVAAGRAGFDAVEFHDEWRRESVADLRAALREAGSGGRPLPVMGLNVRMGDQVGCAAVPGDEERAAEDADEALDAAAALGARAVHVLAGTVEATAETLRTFRANLAATCARAERAGGDAPFILIEPLCPAARETYPLRTVAEAARLVRDVAQLCDLNAGRGTGRLRVMFDLFHVAGVGDDPVEAMRAHAPLVGHVQIADPVTRAEPDGLAPLVRALRDAGYAGAFGAEYAPTGRTEDGLGWMAALGRSGPALPRPQGLRA